MLDLSKGKEWKVILLFALPMLLGNVLQQAYSFVDSIIIGKVLGKEALASTGTSFPILFVLVALAIGVGSGNSVVISQYYGAKKINEVKRAISTQFIFMFAMSIVVTALGLIFNRPLLSLLKVPPEVFEMASKYFEVMMYGTVFIFGYNTISSILRGLGDSTTALYFVIISTIVNIGLDFLFVVYFKWGVAGAAYASVIAQAIAFISAIIYLNKKHDIISFKIKEMVFDNDIFKKSINIGLPTGMQQITVALGMLAVWRIVNDFGADTMAGYTAAGRIDSIATMPCMLIGSALTSFVGQNIGAKQPERIQKGLYATVIMGGILAIFISTLIYVFAEPLINLFITDDAINQKVFQTGINYLRIVSPFYCIFSVMFASHGLLRGAGDTLIPMFITIISLWLFRIPLAYILSQTALQENGIWWSVPIAWGIGMIASIAYYKTGRWKRKKVIH